VRGARSWRGSLRDRLLAAFVLVGVPPVLLLAVAVTTLVSRSFDETAARRLEAGLRAVRSRIAEMERRAATQVTLVAAAAGPADGELLIATDADNLGASHIVTGQPAGNALKVPALRLQRILDEAGVSRVDALKIDVEGFEDRVLTGFFKEAPAALWPGAVVIEHLSRNEWLEDCIADMRARGYAETGKTRSNTLLVKS